MTNYFPLWGFIILMVSTPGPANLLLMSTGAQWGYRRSLPFLSGLVVGKLALNVAMALGFMAVLLNSPRVLTTLSWVYGLSRLASVDTR
jgi:threonine/homoserine/homoserine lactone efflux protein